MVHETSIVEIVIILLFPTGIYTQKDLKIDSFELQVFNKENTPVETYDLIKVNALELQPNTRLLFKCSISGPPPAYVVITNKNRFNRTDQESNKTGATEVEYRIETVDCHHSGPYTCRVGNNQGFRNIATNIIIKCPVTEARFVSNNRDRYVAISKDIEHFLMICEERDLSNSLTLLNQRNRSHRLNYVEHRYKLIYYIPKVTCLDMGTYVCVVNRTNTYQLTKAIRVFVNVTERKMDFSVNNCPPQLCDQSFGNVIKTLEHQTSISLTVCVEVSIGTRIFGVFYHGSWVTNGTCGNKICLESNIQNGSKFQHYLNLTVADIDTTHADDITIKIGSGYNYRNNYINYTILFNKTRRLSETTLSEVTLSFEMTSTHLQTYNASKMHGETQMIDNKASTWITVLVFLCVFLLGLTMILAVVVHFYKKKKSAVVKALASLTMYHTAQESSCEMTYESIDNTLLSQAQGQFSENHSRLAVESYVHNRYVNCSLPVIKPHTALKPNWMTRCWKN